MRKLTNGTIRPGRRGSRRGARRGVRAVAFIYFTGLALPILFLSAAFSVDFTRIIIINRAMSNAASAAAAAGSWQMQPGRVALDEDKARAAATETMCRATEAVHGVSARGASLTPCAAGGQVSADVQFSGYATKVAGYPSNGYTSVSVHTEYNVDHMIFFFYFNHSRAAAGQATQTATVCVPGDGTNFSGGYCTRPQ